MATADVVEDEAVEGVRQAREGDCLELQVETANDRVLAAPLDAVPVTDAYAVQAPAGPRLLVTRQDHPRGGFQIRVFAVGAESLSELVDDGRNPVVPFVATDTTPPTPVSAQCTDRGVRVLQAFAPGPPEDASDLSTGDNEVWRVNATTYDVTEAGASAGDIRRVGTSETLRDLREDVPEVTGNAMFEDCRVR